MPTDEKSIPDDHAIRDIWRINALDMAGFIELANAGDADAAQYLIKLYVRIRKRALEERALGCYLPTYPCDSHVLLEAYVLETLTLEGFNLEKNSHRPMATYKEKIEFCRIGYRVSILIDEYPSKNKAYMMAAKEFNISEAKARHCYEKFMKL